MHRYYVYILASQREGVLYTGVTKDIVRRVQEHKNGSIAGFTKKYYVDQLVYLETYEYVDQALAREKQLKKWNRAWKVDMIEKVNPEWKDLYFELNQLL